MVCVPAHLASYPAARLRGWRVRRTIGELCEHLRFDVAFAVCHGDECLDMSREEETGLALTHDLVDHSLKIKQACLFVAFGHLEGGLMEDLELSHEALVRSGVRIYGSRALQRRVKKQRRTVHLGEPSGSLPARRRGLELA